MKKHLGVFVLLAMPLGVLAAQTQKPADPKAQASSTSAAAAAPPPTSSQAVLVSRAQPTLISNAQPATGDSRLVAAAKRAQAWRQTAAVNNTKIFIDDTYVAKNHISSGGGTVSQATSPNGPPPPQGRSYASGNQGNASQIAAKEQAAKAGKQAEADRRAAEERAGTESAARETDEPYSDADEDQTMQRASHMPPPPPSQPGRP